MAVAGQDAFEPLWTLALLTGMRRGELLGLRWGDIDWDHGTASVRQTRTKAGSAAITKGPKNASSRRTIPLPPAALALLAMHRQCQTLHIEECADAYEDNDLVCCNAYGQPWYPDTATHRFRALVQLAGVPLMNLHYTRHTFASMALRAGESLAAVSEVLGHADRETTLRIYQEVQADQHRAVADAVAGLLMSHLQPDVTCDVTNTEDPHEKSPAGVDAPEGEVVHPWRLERQTFRSAIRRHGLT
jgi:integrase